MSEHSPSLADFLLKDYELKIRYLSDHFARIWVRFNFFLTMHTALSVALFGWFKDKDAFDPKALPIANVGAIAAICWYFFGAQDRYLVALYREQINIVAEQLAAALNVRHQLDALDLPSDRRIYLPVGDIQGPTIQPNIYQWRLKHFSTTKLVAWFPLVVTLYWVIVMWLIAC